MLKTKLVKQTDDAKAKAAWTAVRRAEAEFGAVLETARPGGSWAVLGSMPDGDIEALAFLVLMQASKSAQEDLKAIMAGVKAINARKAKLRELLGEKQQEGARLDPDAYARAVLTMQVDLMVDEIRRDLDSMSEMGEMESLRLQMAMDRMSKMMSTLSNLLKKLADTQQSIVQNLK
ncbi:hypothetical protein [Sandaracinobacteroides hominis]|uniref:hypothetical protein n=1 Tax=Sandaracinobacteroides hominis TaxID=2780086 RepID=UPI0018F53501|nr:hypothetical protein [Sandaracinobacteroides hominis]